VKAGAVDVIVINVKKMLRNVKNAFLGATAVPAGTAESAY